MTIPSVGQTRRRRLPNRRRSLTETIRFCRGDGAVVEYAATIGFDEVGRPKEIFLFGAKDGTDMASVPADAAVVISIGLQHGISAKAFGASASRVSQGDGLPTMPRSIIGAAFDFLGRWECES